MHLTLTQLTIFQSIVCILQSFSKSLQLKPLKSRLSSTNETYVNIKLVHAQTIWVILNSSVTFSSYCIQFLDKDYMVFYCTQFHSLLDQLINCEINFLDNSLAQNPIQQPLSCHENHDEIKLLRLSCNLLCTSVHNLTQYQSIQKF